MIGENAEAVKITAIDEQGNPVVQYALPQNARMIGRMSFEQYGNIQYEGITFDELPESIRETFKEAARSAPKL